MFKVGSHFDALFNTMSFEKFDSMTEGSNIFILNVEKLRENEIPSEVYNFLLMTFLTIDTIGNKVFANTYF